MNAGRWMCEWDGEDEGTVQRIDRPLSWSRRIEGGGVVVQHTMIRSRDK